MSNILEQKLTNLITPQPSDPVVNARFKNDNFYSDNLCDIVALLNDTPNQKLSDSITAKIYDFLTETNVPTLKFTLPTYSGFQNLKTTEAIINFLKNHNINFPEVAFNKVSNVEQLQLLAAEVIRQKKIQIIDALNAIIQKSFIKETENGSCFLYIGHFFLKGSFAKGISAPIELNAPLLMTAVKVKILNNESIVFEKRETSYNSRLFLFLEKNNLGNFPYISLAKKNQLDDTIYTDLIDNIKSLFNRNSEEIKVNLRNFTIRQADSKLIPFAVKENQRTFTIENNLMLMFAEPKGGAIKEDISKIKDRGNLDEIFRPKIWDTFKDGVRRAFVNSQIKLAQIGRPLNFSQQVAAAATLSSDTVIFGPPGTGKSETIATIIANFLTLKNTVNETNKILMVSSKKAALDVIEERLFKIADLVLPGFETNPAKIDKFYKKIINLYRHLQEDLKPAPIILADEMSHYASQLKSVHDVLTKKDYSNNVETDIKELIKAYEAVDKQLYEEMESTKLIQDINIVLANLTTPPSISTLPDLYAKFKEELDALELFKTKLSKRQDTNLFVKIWPNAESREAFMTALNANYSDQQRREIIISIVMGALEECEFSAKPNRQMIDWYNSEEEPLKIKASTVVKKLNTLHIADISFIHLTKLLRIRNYDQVALQHFMTIQKWLKILGFGKLEDLKKLDINTITRNYYDKISSKKSNLDEIIFQNYVFELQSRYRSLPEGEDLNENYGEGVLTKRRLTNLISIAQRSYKLPINTFLKRFQNELLFLFPIWVLNPIQVSSATPCESGLFDVGIFDEASQMFLEQAYPILYRVKRKVVAGDDKQMKPVAYFMNTLQLSEEDKQNDENGDLAESLLDKAKTCGWETHFISNHYRSDQDSNIKFVNKWIYDNNLSIVPKNQKFENDIETIFLENNFLEDSDTVNELEIHKTIEQILIHHKQNKAVVDVENKKISQANLNNPDKTPTPLIDLDSIMVVCFNNKQQEMLDKKISDVTFMKKICSEGFTYETIDERKLRLPPKKIPAKIYRTEAEQEQERSKTEARLAESLARSNKTEAEIVFSLKKDIENFVKWNFNYEAILEMLTPLNTVFEVMTLMKRFEITKEDVKAAREKSNNPQPTETVSNSTNTLCEEDGLEVRERYLNNEIKVRNLDNVQGSEADLVIISTNVAPKQRENNRTLNLQKYKLVEPQGRFSLNVAITRAKKKTIIIKSFKIGEEKWELQNKASGYEDWNVFYEWVDFVEKFKANKSVELTSNTEIEDPLWKTVHNFLMSSLTEERKSQLLFLENVKLGNFTIDFMIYDKKTQTKKILFLKNNLFEKDQYNLVELVAFNDKIKYLKDRGYAVSQIIPFFFNLNRNKILNSLVKVLS